MAYLTLQDFTDRTVAPTSYITEVETDQPGWTLKQINMWGRWIDARLGKRYAVPFDTDTPEVIKNWLSRLITWELYLKRGINPDDAQVAMIQERATTAEAEVKEAATGDTGLFEIPLKETPKPDAEGITRGAPLAYTEAGPYAWSRVQRANALNDPE
jgi:hypothetical protein